MAEAEFRLLGPVEIVGPGGPVPLGGPRGASILSVLLLEIGRTVSIDQLIDAAWVGDPPTTARTQAQNRVSVLRRALQAAGADPSMVSTRGTGYAIHADPDQVDLYRFQALAAAGSALDAQALLREALALWRGPALVGLHTVRSGPRPSDWNRHACGRWNGGSNSTFRSAGTSSSFPSSPA